MREWISVKDALPDIGKRVLAADCDREGYPRQFVAWRAGGYGWQADGAYPVLRKLYRVTHWMPLPPHPTTDTD